MTREVRVNLIFLVCLAIFISPGFGILMYRKLHGTARPNDLPDPVPTAVAYCQPLPVDPRLPRREPRIVRDWVRQLLQAREGPNYMVTRATDDPESGPLVSDQYVTQLVGMVPLEDGSQRLSILRWDEKTDLATEQPKLTADIDGRRIDGTILRTESMELPREVRHALQDVGYVIPPLRVWWITATLPTKANDAKPSSLTLQYRLTGPDKPETIRLAPAVAPTTEPTS